MKYVVIFLIILVGIDNIVWKYCFWSPAITMMMEHRQKPKTDIKFP